MAHLSGARVQGEEETLPGEGCVPVQRVAAPRPWNQVSLSLGLTHLIYTIKIAFFFFKSPPKEMPFHPPVGAFLLVYSVV